MAVGQDDPAVQWRRLRVELRKARLDAGQTQRDVAEAMDWSTSKLIRIENGDVRISRNDLLALLSHYEITDKRRVDSLVSMARTAREESWSDFRDVHSAAFLTYLGFESSAWIIRVYEITFIPGLLQTSDYYRATQLNVRMEGDDTAERRWAARERRQRLHDGADPPKMFFILDEAVIRRRVGGPKIMRRQLQHLREMSAAPHITIQIVPFVAGASPGMNGPFTLVEFRDPNDDNVVYIEADTETTVRDDPGPTSIYLDRFFTLEKSYALPADESLVLIDEVIAELAAEASAPLEEASTS